MKPSIGISDDYASCSFGHYKFYYGYEKEICKCGAMNCKNEDHDGYNDKEWCFFADLDGEYITIPGSKIGLDMNGDMAENVLTGIMWLFAKYNLKKKPQFQSDEEWLADYNDAKLS